MPERVLRKTVSPERILLGEISVEVVVENATVVVVGAAVVVVCVDVVVTLEVVVVMVVVSVAVVGGLVVLPREASSTQWLSKHHFERRC